jgi:peptidoglycan/LPS O-acetylase OafA/YrhL
VNTVTAPAKTGQAGRRRRDIQGLRGIAILMVVVYHATLPLPGGFTGVDVFFVISGFVITGLHRRQHQTTGRVSFGSFYSRRARRLLPALAVVTSLTAVAATLLESPIGAQQTTGSMGAATSLFVANFQAYREPSGYFGTGSITDPLLHMWSLGVEEQFYLVFPLLLLLAWTVAKRLRLTPERTVATIIAAGTLLSLALCIVVTRHHPTFAFFLLPTRAWEFGIGALVELAEPILQRFARPYIIAVVSVAGVELIVVACLGVSSTSAFPGWIALWPTLGAACLLAAGTMTHRGIPQVLSIPPLVWIGDISYSWYLWHWPAVVLLRAAIPNSSWPPVLGAFASIIPAWLSYTWLENPIRRSKGIRGARLIAVAALCILLPLGLSKVLRTAAQHGWGKPSLRAAAVAGVTNTLANRHGCLADGTVDTATLSRRCSWTVRHPKGFVMLVGDSHAAALSDAVIADGNAMGYRVLVSPGASCSVTKWAYLDTDIVTNCRQLYQWDLREATGAVKPRLVILAHADSEEAAGLAKTGIHASVRAWVSGVVRTLRTLAAAHVPVLLVDDVPRITLQPDECRFGALYAMRCEVSRGIDNRVQGPADDAVAAAAAHVPGVYVTSLESAFCTRTTCNAIQHGTLMYLDNQHLDDAGSRDVAPDIDRAMRKALQLG